MILIFNELLYNMFFCYFVYSKVNKMIYFQSGGARGFIPKELAVISETLLEPTVEVYDHHGNTSLPLTTLFTFLTKIFNFYVSACAPYGPYICTSGTLLYAVIFISTEISVK